MIRVLAILSLLSVASALYFHIAETERKCFIEEIPDETMVSGEGRGYGCLQLSNGQRFV